jgi:hypothetical protein
MVSRREVLAGILVVATVVVVGGYAELRLRKKQSQGQPPPPVTSTSGKATIPGAMHFPTTLESPAFSDASMDSLFTDMLAAMGVKMVAFEWDYQVFSDSRWSSRLIDAHNYARSKGLMTHIINQMQPAFWSAGGINPPPSSSTTSSSIGSYEAEIASAYAQLKPDYLSVIAEPSNLQQKFKFNFSSSQWASLVQDLVGQASGSGSSLWVDLVPNSGFDMGLIPSMVGVSGLDGIGMDLYGQSNESTVQDHLSTIVNAGKSWGLSETWWGPLYASPSLDTVQNAPHMASWFSQSLPWAMQYGAVMYNPFFTNLFLQEPSTIAYDNADLTEYFSEELSLLQKDSYTSIHDAYSQTIASLG